MDTNNNKKAMAYDLRKILKNAENTGRESFTIQEIENLIDNYITAATSKS